jgi:hypothetical protein
LVGLELQRGPSIRQEIAIARGVNRLPLFAFRVFCESLRGLKVEPAPESQQQHQDYQQQCQDSQQLRSKQEVESKSGA